MRRKLTKRQKERSAFFGGLAFVIVGFWMIFIAKDNLGFLPAILGTILMLWRW